MFPNQSLRITEYSIWAQEGFRGTSGLLWVFWFNLITIIMKTPDFLIPSKLNFCSRERDQKHYSFRKGTLLWGNPSKGSPISMRHQGAAKELVGDQPRGVPKIAAETLQPALSAPSLLIPSSWGRDVLPNTAPMILGLLERCKTNDPVGRLLRSLFLKCIVLCELQSSSPSVILWERRSPLD